MTATAKPESPVASLRIGVAMWQNWLAGQVREAKSKRRREVRISVDGAKELAWLLDRGVPIPGATE